MSENLDSTQLWQFVPIRKYTKPPKPLEETVRQGIKDIFRKILPTKGSTDFLNQKELRALPLTKLDKIVSFPDWTGAVDALNLVLEEWVKFGPSKGNIVFIINHPFEGTKEILTRWGKKQDWVILDPPRRKEILDGSSNGFFFQIKDTNTSFILPSLEHWYTQSIFL